MNESINETISCDLGDKKTALFLLGARGEETRLKSISTTKEGFRAFFSRQPAHVVLEAGTHSPWVSELLKELGHRVTVANPRKVKLISGSHTKSDENDAELLARLGRADPKLLSPIQHRGTESLADLAIIKVRDVLVGNRTRLVNQARGLVKSFGERLPKCETESFHRTAWPAVPARLQAVLKPLFNALESLEQQIRSCEKQLAETAKKYPDVETISQPKGVGLLTAMTFLLTLEDKTRFRNSRAVGAFIGLTPRRDQSGDRDKQLGITKAGDPLLRRLLVISANYILGPFGPDTDLKRFGLKIAKTGGKNAKKRAKVAVARKLSVLMHRLWVTGEVYEPLRNASSQMN